MNYPKLLCRGDTIGICAPSSGVSGDLIPRFENAIRNVQSLGYHVIETRTVRNRYKCTSADSAVRAAEFMELYENPEVNAIIPPWGGEFLMEILPLLDFYKIRSLPPKWISGYSDISTLTFPLTLICDIATIHGSNFMNMGGLCIDESDQRVFEVMSDTQSIQKNFPYYGVYSDEFTNIQKETYSFTKKSAWKTLSGNACHIKGRMIGGCMDVLNILVGTEYAPVERFIDRYKGDGFIWVLESCEMTAAEIYRAFWHMRENGWFRCCNGFIIGRPDGYSDTREFTLVDALERGIGGLNVPVIYDADIGHIPPILQIVNGAYGEVEFNDGHAVIKQILK
jgi:muramoyltetrapeptide carboxypeptidase LdcA involved in peptidoglycan recycling